MHRRKKRWMQNRCQRLGWEWCMKRRLCAFVWSGKKNPCSRDTEESPSTTTSCTPGSLGEGHNLYVFVHYMKPSCDTHRLYRMNVSAGVLMCHKSVQCKTDSACAAGCVCWLKAGFDGPNHCLSSIRHVYHLIPLNFTSLLRRQRPELQWLQSNFSPLCADLKPILMSLNVAFRH